MNIRDSRKDKVAVENFKNDPSVHRNHWLMYYEAAKGRRSSQWTRFRISLYIDTVGIYGVLQPNPLGGRTTGTALFLTACLLAIAAETAGRSIRDYQQADKLYELGLSRTTVKAARLRARHLPPIK